ncbi:MAG: hypothetical protein VYA54_07015 [Bdellovibrionota bacterium]|nr:hypothetical protein [Bdellovibrionota bacterium]
MKKGFFLACLAITPAFAQNYEIHVLKEGETLSEVLYAKGYIPLYGENNWVQKTLEMNHLSSTQDKKLKKDFPVILPHRPEEEIAKSSPQTGEATKEVIYREKLVYQSRPRKGLLGGLISEHQDVFLNFSHRQTQSSYVGTTVSQREKFSVGLNVNGNNLRRLGNIIYDWNAGLEINSQGSASFTSNDQRNATLDPSIEAYTELDIISAKIPFEFGPRFILEEKSRISQLDEDNFGTRRDRIFWLGFNAHKSFKALGSELETGINLKTSFLQTSLTDEKDFSASGINAYAQMQLTNDYFVGLNIESIQYDQINLASEQSFGLNFKYQLK